MRGKPGNKVTNIQTLYLILLHIYSYYSTFIVAYTRIARYDLANAILYFAYCKYSEQLASHASEFVSILQYPELKSIVQCTLLCMHSIGFSKKNTVH